MSGLDDQVREYSLRDLPTMTAGAMPSPNGRKSNPRFWEALMGWPVGWTDCASPATGLSRWRRLMPGALSELALLATMRSDGQLIMSFAA
jgi:hypothetical protein